MLGLCFVGLVDIVRWKVIDPEQIISSLLNKTRLMEILIEDVSSDPRN